jgi:hypothetical protein
VLEKDAATGAEEEREETVEDVGPTAPVLGAGGFPEAAIGLEGGGDAIRVAGRQGRLVLPDDIGFRDGRISRKERRADHVVAQQWPLAVVGADPDAALRRVGFHHDRDG